MSLCVRLLGATNETSRDVDGNCGIALYFGIFDVIAMTVSLSTSAMKSG